MLICYITNPVVVLFADEDGELHGFWHYWQTWDNSCNPSEIENILPKFLQYDWNRHYKEREGTTNYLKRVNRTRWFTECIDNNFTTIERIKRYIGRVWWLTRNCSYGWSFYVFGRTVPAFSLDMIIDKTDEIYIKNNNFNILNGVWMYKSAKKIFTLFNYEVRWNNFLGWKLSYPGELDTRSMIANRIALSFEKV